MVEPEVVLVIRITTHKIKNRVYTLFPHALIHVEFIVYCCMDQIYGYVEEHVVQRMFYIFCNVSTSVAVFISVECNILIIVLSCPPKIFTGNLADS